MTRPLHVATQFLFVTTEGLAWFLVIRVFATSLERGTWRELANRIEAGLQSGAYADQLAASNALNIAREASERVQAGPSLLIVLAAGLGAYWLAQWITQAQLGSAGTVVGLIVSALVLNGLLHLVFAGDLRVWDSGGLARFVDNPQSSFVGELQPELFVQSPDPASVEGISFAVVAMGMFAIWLRFLISGRRALTFDRVLRSFSVGFPFVLVAAFAATLGHQGVGILALLYFVLGVLTLAVANAARAADRGEQLVRTAPWAASLLITLGLLGGVALAFGLLAFLEVERAIAPLGGAVIALIELALVIVLTPIFWALERLFSLFGTPDFSFVEDALQQNQEFLDANQERTDREPLQFPGWIGNALRLGLLALLAVGGYWIGRFLFGRAPDDDPDDYDELRTPVGSGGGMSGMLRNLVPGFGRRAQPGNWTDRHAVYRLFGRVVGDSDERGFPRRAGETPLEFASIAGRTLDAPEFDSIAEAFDRARYGRHYAGDDEVSALEEALNNWEETHPATAEWRREVAREEAQEEVLPKPEIATPAEDEADIADRMGPI